MEKVIRPIVISANQGLTADFSHCSAENEYVAPLKRLFETSAQCLCQSANDGFENQNTEELTLPGSFGGKKSGQNHHGPVENLPAGLSQLVLSHTKMDFWSSKIVRDVAKILFID